MNVLKFYHFVLIIISPVKSRHELEKEKLKEALVTPIAQESKGWKMLRSIGYNPGEGLGKDSQGMIEPIPLTFHQGRTGLGLISEQKKKARIIEEQRASRLSQTVMDAFKDRTRTKFMERKVLSQHRSCIELCVQMDGEKNITDSPFVKAYNEEEQRKIDEGDAYEPTILEVLFLFLFLLYLAFCDDC